MDIGTRLHNYKDKHNLVPPERRPYPWLTLDRSGSKRACKKRMMPVMPEQSVGKLDLGALTVSAGPNEQPLDHNLVLSLVE